MPREALDATDERILQLLEADGRLSASAIGREVGLSPAAAKRRIDRLEELRIVTGYRAVIDHAKLGWQIEAFVELRVDGSTHVDGITAAYADLPELVEGFTLAGDPDALIRLRVRDHAHLKEAIDRIRRSGGVTGTKTLIVLGAEVNRA